MKSLPLLLLVAKALAFHKSCKATPGSSSWPLIQCGKNSTKRFQVAPPPLAAACHADQATFSSSTCNYVTYAWQNSTFHSDDPIRVDFENWNNDTCLLDPTAPCSGAGYSVYVINATNAEDVRAGIDFARKHNVRLIVNVVGMTIRAGRAYPAFNTDPR
jgi:hypothetical protein